MAAEHLLHWKLRWSAPRAVATPANTQPVRRYFHLQLSEFHPSSGHPTTIREMARYPKIVRTLFENNLILSLR